MTMSAATRRRIAERAQAPGEFEGPLSRTEDAQSQRDRNSVSPPVSNRGGSVIPEELSEDEREIHERHATLSKLVKRQRLKNEIELLEKELAGDEQASIVPIEGVAMPFRKRAITTTAESSSTKHLKLATPPTFAGKSITELQKYDIGWKIQLEARSSAGEAYAESIRIAATYLRDAAAAAWARRTDDTPTESWEKYIEFLRDIIADPANRMANALVRLKDKKQREGQTARELLQEIENLEHDIPPLTEDERKAWMFLDSLTPELRTEIMRENKQISSREQVLAAAQRHEELSKQRVRAEKKTVSTTTKQVKTESGAPAKYVRQTSSTQKTSENKPGSFPFKCHKCHETGHKAANCPRSSTQRNTSNTSTSLEERVSKAPSKN